MRRNQKERIYEYIEEEYQKNGYSPSISDIAAHLGLCAKSNIHRQLQQLVSDDRLKNLGGRYVPTRFLNSSPENAEMVPLLGRVAAGVPITAVENFDGYVAYTPKSKNGHELFALNVKGDSMTDAGILDGDIVIVEQTPAVQNGEIAVAMINGEATVKTFYAENGHIRLQPHNSAYEPIIVDKAVILGRVVANIRYY